MSSDAPAAKDYYQYSNPALPQEDHTMCEAIHHRHHQLGPSQQQYLNHAGPSGDHKQSPNLTRHSDPWQTADFGRSGASPMSQGSMGPYIGQGPQAGQNLDYSAISGGSPSSLYAPSQFMGVLTPDQSPHTATLSVVDDRAYPSEPPRPQSPPLQESLELVSRVIKSSSPVQRPDGVRKKNAKFEIPEGRTISSIESLLRKAKDDGVIKELKSQKRLLKNREAALQSRARKKAYTERLEDENKKLSSALGRDGNSQHRQSSTLRSGPHEDDAEQRDNHYVQYIARLKEDMTMMHQENQQLHVENSALREQLQHTFSTPASTGFSSTGYSTGIDEGGNMAFDANSFDFLNEEMCLNSDVTVIKKELAGEATLVDTTMLPSSPNVMLKLLMYGAHVASFSSPHHPSTTTMPTLSIPTLSREECEASANLLHTLFGSSGNSMQIGRTHSSTKLDLNNLTAANVQAISEFKALCDDASNRGNLFLSRNS